jgi:hypothetical protein
MQIGAFSGVRVAKQLAPRREDYHDDVVLQKLIGEAVK